MYFDRVDICAAYYLFASLYHGGQWSKEYRIFGRLNTIGFHPSIMLMSRKALPSENSKAIYDALVKRRKKG